MPPKPEYWTLTEQQFKQLKTQLDEFGQYAYTQLEPMGFTKFESQPDWLGFTIKKKEGEQLTIVGLSLIREKPLELELIARQWQVRNPSETFVDLYQKSFASIEEIIESRESMFAALKDNLRNRP